MLFPMFRSESLVIACSDHRFCPGFADFGLGNLSFALEPPIFVLEYAKICIPKSNHNSQGKNQKNCANMNKQQDFDWGFLVLTCHMSHVSQVRNIFPKMTKIFI